MKDKYPKRKVIAVDVDGTLYSRGRVNVSLVDWCRDHKQAGYNLILWSSRGQAYAQTAAENAGMMDVFDHIISKPGYIVDNDGWSWIKYTAIIRVPMTYGKKGTTEG